MKRAWIIIPVFNRREITLACLRSLQPGIASGSFEVVVVDDGSSDGTSEAIARDFSEVHLLQGGDLYWTGAMEKGMRYAMERGVEIIFWLNDDSIFELSAFHKISERLRHTKGIVSAQGRILSKNYEEGFWRFPLIQRGKNKLKYLDVDGSSEERIISCDAVRGNLVGIYVGVIEQIGFPDARLCPQVNGDSDYSLRASSAGMPVEVMLDVFVTEIPPENWVQESWLTVNQSSWSLFLSIFHQKSAYNPKMVFGYHWRHWKLCGVIGVIFRYGKIFFILLIKSFYFSKKD